MALEHVAQGQQRLQTPGLAPDARGVALGRYAVLLFGTLEGVVSWLRLYAAEASLDELIGELEIARVRSSLGSRELLIRIPAVSSYACDRAARLARLLGGATYTGSARHFVKYRDDRAPLGYDAVDIGPLPADADLVIYGDEFTQSYKRDGLIDLASLLRRLSIRRVPGNAHLSPEARRELLVAVPRGLAEGVIRYMWRNRVAGEAALVAPSGGSAFADDAARRGYLLFRLREVPERIVQLLLDVPGIEVFRQAGASVAVALGWAHPIDLASCASVFPVDRLHLFWPGDRIDVLAAPIEYADLARLTNIEVDADRDGIPDRQELDDAAARAARRTQAAAAITVTLRLAPALTPPRRVAATLVPLAQAERLRRLVFALPPASLRGYRMVTTDRGVLILAQGAIDLIPLGELLCEQAPGILVPLGLELVPRVSPDILARALGHDAGMWTLFDRAGQAVRIGDAELASMERRILSTALVEAAVVTSLDVEPLGTPELVNDEVGRFALWGFADPDAGGDGQKRLPP